MFSYFFESSVTRRRRRRKKKEEEREVDNEKSEVSVGSRGKTVEKTDNFRDIYAKDDRWCGTFIIVYFFLISIYI